MWVVFVVLCSGPSMLCSPGCSPSCPVYQVWGLAGVILWSCCCSSTTVALLPWEGRWYYVLLLSFEAEFMDALGTLFCFFFLWPSFSKFSVLKVSIYHKSWLIFVLTVFFPSYFGILVHLENSVYNSLVGWYLHALFFFVSTSLNCEH